MSILVRMLAPVWVLLVAGCGPGDAPFMIGAAASAADALPRAVDRWAAESGLEERPRMSFAASSLIARQVAAGAPFDLVLTADRRWMDELDGEGLIEPSTITVLAENQLAIAARPGAAELAAEIRAALESGGARLPDHLRDARWTTGDPAHVPAGMFAQQALEALGWWGALEDGLIAARDVRAGLSLVRLGEADLCICYRSDLAEHELDHALLDPGLHGRIEVLAALTVGASEEARTFLGWLASPASAAFGAADGFMEPEGRR